jgi:hypothetical protein
MSFTEDDRKVQSENGKTFPKRAGYDGPPIAPVIAAALKADFGATPSAMKHIARLTGANERAVRNWMGSNNRPSAELLICLMCHSDSVFVAMLELAKRDRPSQSNGLADLRSHLVSALAVIDGVQPL